MIVMSAMVDIFNSTNTTLSKARRYLDAASLGDLALFAGGVSTLHSDYAMVDIFNATSGS